MKTQLNPKQFSKSERLYKRAVFKADFYNRHRNELSFEVSERCEGEVTTAWSYPLYLQYLKEAEEYGVLDVILEDDERLRIDYEFLKGQKEL